MANTTPPAAVLTTRIWLRTYLDYRLGRNQPWWRRTYNVLVQPLAAPSLTEFTSTLEHLGTISMRQCPVV